MSENFKEKLRNVRCLVFDIDGVLTDGRLHILQDGIMLRKMNIKDAFESSYKMSLVSILIMMLTENVIILFIIPEFLSGQMHMKMGITHDFKTMFIAMGCGFLFSLPYNYHQLQKTGRICH